MTNESSCFWKLGITKVYKVIIVDASLLCKSCVLHPIPHVIHHRCINQWHSLSAQSEDHKNIYVRDLRCSTLLVSSFYISVFKGIWRIPLFVTIKSNNKIKILSSVVIPYV